MNASRIDSHQHFWLMRDRAGQWPPASLQDIYRDFMPEDLTPILQACGVEGTVLVQSLPAIKDTEFMLKLSDQHPFILGVVGWANLKAPNAPAEIAGLAAHPKLRVCGPCSRTWLTRHGSTIISLIRP